MNGKIIGLSITTEKHLMPNKLVNQLKWSVKSQTEAFSFIKTFNLIYLLCLFYVYLMFIVRKIMSQKSGFKFAFKHALNYNMIAKNLW